MMLVLSIERNKTEKAHTDFELSMYPLHISVSVLGLDFITVTHHFQKFTRQNTMLLKDVEEKREEQIILSQNNTVHVSYLQIFIIY